MIVLGLEPDSHHLSRNAMRLDESLNIYIRCIGMYKKEVESVRCDM